MHLELLQIEKTAEATGYLIFKKIAGNIARIPLQSALKTASQRNEKSLEISKERYKLSEKWKDTVDDLRLKWYMINRTEYQKLIILLIFHSIFHYILF